MEETAKTIVVVKAHKPSWVFSVISLLFLAFYLLPEILASFSSHEVPPFFTATSKTFWLIAFSLLLVLAFGVILYVAFNRKPTRSPARFLSFGFLLFSVASFIAGCYFLHAIDSLSSYYYYFQLALLCLLVALNLFYWSFSYRIYQVERGNTTIQLTVWEQRRLAFSAEGTKKASAIFFEGVSWLFFAAVLLVCLFLYPDLTSSDGGSLLFIYTLLAGWSLYPLIAFAAYLAGGWFYNLWVMKEGRSKRSRIMLVPLIGALAIGLIGIPCTYEAAREHREWATTYTREKWQAANEDDRYLMLPDFQKQVNLVGQSYGDMIYYLSEPDKNGKEGSQTYYDYALGTWSSLHHTFERYYRVSFSDGVISEAASTSERL